MVLKQRQCRIANRKHGIRLNWCDQLSLSELAASGFQVILGLITLSSLGVHSCKCSQAMINLVYKVMWNFHLQRLITKSFPLPPSHSHKILYNKSLDFTPFQHTSPLPGQKKQSSKFNTESKGDLFNVHARVCAHLHACMCGGWRVTWISFSITLHLFFSFKRQHLSPNLELALLARVAG